MHSTAIAPRTELVFRHALVVRITHWVNADARLSVQRSTLRRPARITPDLSKPDIVVIKPERISGVKLLGVLEVQSFGRVTPFWPIYLPARSA